MPTRAYCSTTHCPGPRCARSTPCSPLVKKWGADRVATACAKAADAEAFNVGLIGRMLERATENNAPIEVGTVQASLFPARFARSAAEFATGAGREVSA